MEVVSKEVLDIPYNGELNAFTFDLGPYTYLSDEDTVCIFTCLPGVIDPDDGNDWGKVLEYWYEDNQWNVICQTCGKPLWLYGNQEPAECCTCE